MSKILKKTSNICKKKCQITSTIRQYFGDRLFECNHSIGNSGQRSMDNNYCSCVNLKSALKKILGIWYHGTDE